MRTLINTMVSWLVDSAPRVGVAVVAGGILQDIAVLVHDSHGSREGLFDILSPEKPYEHSTFPSDWCTRSFVRRGCARVHGAVHTVCSTLHTFAERCTRSLSTTKRQ